MKKRLICTLLAVVMLFGMVSVSATSVNAASSLKTSEACIALIKQLEGFQFTPKLDYSQYSVGYGSACNKGDYPNGITEAEADKLLRADIAELESTVNKFADKNGLTFTQQQFDALISFTYNVGANWMNDAEGMFRKAVVNGSNGNDFIFAIARWSTAGVGDNKAVQLGLVNRRLAEANLYLNGVYSSGVPANYTYVVYNTNIADCTNTIRVQAYDSTVGDTVKAVPSKSGYRFLGWYTAASGGKEITALNANTACMNLYAHWQKGEGEVDANGAVVGTPANYTAYAAPDGNQVVYEQPNTDAKQMKKLAANVEVVIVAEHMDNNGVKWGKLSEGGWVSLKEASQEIQPTDVLDEPLTLTVTHNGVNIRFGPGTKYDKIGKAYKDQQITITGTQKGGQYLWGKFDGGWICLDYTDYETVLAENSAEDEEVTAIGTVIRTSKLNVRSGPGTSYAKAGSLNGGDTVRITLQKEVNGKIWYKIATGWVHSYYISATPIEDAELPEETTPPTESTEATKPEESTTPTQPEDDKSEEEDGATDTGTVFNCNTLRIRAGAGTNYAHVGDLARGTRVEIYEYTVVRGAVWGRIAQGWIHMSYIQLDESTSEEGAVMATVVKCTKVNVRSGAGTGYAKVGQLKAGTRVQVLQLMQLSSGKIWARVSQGWIHTDYLQLDAVSDSGNSGSGSGNTDTGNTGTTEPDNGSTGSGTTTPDSSGSSSSGSADIVVGTTSDVKLTGTIVKTDSLRVRSGPGTKYEHIADLTGGTRVEILERSNVGSTTWGRTQYGWISLYYVQLDAATSVEGAVAVTVTADTLHIRSAAGAQNKKVGDYRRGNIIVILEQTIVDGSTWGRTDLGWICMDYVK